MPHRISRRKRSFDQQFDLNAEKAASEVHTPARRRPVVYLSELVGGGQTMTCCDSPVCVCTCPECGEQSIAGMRCEGLCEQVHEERVAREQRESIEQAAWVEAQLAMEAV